MCKPDPLLHPPIALWPATSLLVSVRSDSQAEAAQISRAFEEISEPTRKPPDSGTEADQLASKATSASIGVYNAAFMQHLIGRNIYPPFHQFPNETSLSSPADIAELQRSEPC
ncbi:hypothetical protein PG991_008189 [Apiospora marii]|uniref:Uncharacterized protein n=1 Tax=Apiospora marii TaxID=335849 RepID=A0ABR1RVL1_9PEZI